MTQKKKKVAWSPAADLETIPGVGPRIAEVLRDLGCSKVGDLRALDPERMYGDLCALRGTYVDRCVLYVFRCAIYYAGRSVHDPELLKWWNWKDGEVKSR